MKSFKLRFNVTRQRIWRNHSVMLIKRPYGKNKVVWPEGQWSCVQTDNICNSNHVTSQAHKIEWSVFSLQVSKLLVAQVTAQLCLQVRLIRAAQVWKERQQQLRRIGSWKMEIKSPSIDLDKGLWLFYVQIFKPHNSFRITVAHAL